MKHQTLSTKQNHHQQHPPNIQEANSDSSESYPVPVEHSTVLNISNSISNSNAIAERLVESQTLLNHNFDFSKLYQKVNKELLLHHFLILAVSGNDVWCRNSVSKITMAEQEALMIDRYIYWVDNYFHDFPALYRPPDISDGWWRSMLLITQKKIITGQNLWRKFREELRRPILNSFNRHWVVPINEEEFELNLLAVKRGVWADLGNDPSKFRSDVPWFPKQWYAWQWTGKPGRNLPAFMEENIPLSMTGIHSGVDLSGINSRQTGAIPTESFSTDHIDPNKLNNSTLFSASGLYSNKTKTRQSLPLPSNLDTSGLLSPMVESSSSRAASKAAAIVSSHQLFHRPREEEEEEESHCSDLTNWYMIEMTRLEKAIALAEKFGDLEKKEGFEKQLYAHVSTPPLVPQLIPGGRKRKRTDLLLPGLAMSRAVDPGQTENRTDNGNGHEVLMGEQLTQQQQHGNIKLKKDFFD